MAQIVCIIGNKGGTGKTTLSHMIAHGMGLLGKHAVCVLTDFDRDKLSKVNRRYLPFDARAPENLAKVIRTLNNVPDWFGVIDGGGNRPDMDRKLAGLSDLVLLPFRDSHEDIRTVIKDLERFPDAYALPCQWPTNPWAREAADRMVQHALTPYANRILDPIPVLAASKQLLMDEVPARLPTALNSACSQLAMQILELWGLSFATDPAAVLGQPVPSAVRPMVSSSVRVPAMAIAA